MSDYWPLTYDVLHELIYGYSALGGGRQWTDDQLRDQWGRHRLAILDFHAGRPTAGAERIERIWRGDSNRSWSATSEQPWAEREFPAQKT